MSQWLESRPLIDEMVNRQFDAPEFKKLLAVPLTPGRIQVHRHHMTYYGANRRDCWAFVSGKAPLDVKRAIWAHEKDELIHDVRMGRAHVTEEDLRERDESLLVPGAKAAFYAWLYCAREKPWLEGLFYSHILERRNNNVVVKGGGLSERWKRKQQADLGVKEAAKDFQTEVPFREAHEVVGHLVVWCQVHDCDLADVTDADLAKVSEHLTPDVRQVLTVDGAPAAPQESG